MRVDFETDVGIVRSSNQDSCDCGLFSPNSAWAIVCDGTVSYTHLAVYKRQGHGCAGFRQGKIFSYRARLCARRSE